MRHFKAPKLLKNRHGLSTPVTELIIVVAAVALSTIVISYAMNVTASQVQKEKLFIANTQIWYVNNSESVAAIGITNVGPTESVITKININGVQCQWNGTNNYIVYCSINGTIPGDLPFTDQISNVANTTISIAGQPFQFSPASEGLTIKPGSSIAFYVVLPNCINVYNISTPMDIVITTTQSVYCAQTVVQST